MRRRDLLIAGLAASAWTCGATGQVSAKVLRVGMLRIGPPPPSFIDPLRQGLNDLGYVEGRNLVIESGFGGSVAELPAIAADLVRRNIDVLVASGSPAVLPARNATQTIPVVFVAAIDPIAVGLVSNLARPSGNVTGFTALFADLMGKRLELLQEILPSLSDVVLLSREANPGHAQYVREIETAARTLNVKVRVLLVTNPSDFEQVFRQVEGADALIQIDDAMFTAHRHELVALAAKHRIPGVYGPREFVDLGGFAAFGPSYSDLYLRAAAYVDRIFKGTKPGDLPVQQPAKFELVLNPKTANSLGLTIPPTLLARADEVIE